MSCRETLCSVSCAVRYNSTCFSGLFLTPVAFLPPCFALSRSSAASVHSGAGTSFFAGLGLPHAFGDRKRSPGLWHLASLHGMYARGSTSFSHGRPSSVPSHSARISLAVHGIPAAAPHKHAASAKVASAARAPRIGDWRHSCRLEIFRPKVSAFGRFRSGFRVGWLTRPSSSRTLERAMASRLVQAHTTAFGSSVSRVSRRAFPGAAQPRSDGRASRGVLARPAPGPARGRTSFLIRGVVGQVRRERGRGPLGGPFAAAAAAHRGRAAGTRAEQLVVRHASRFRRREVARGDLEQRSQTTRDRRSGERL